MNKIKLKKKYCIGFAIHQHESAMGKKNKNKNVYMKKKRMLTKLSKRVEENSKNFKKELKNISVKNTIIEMKDTKVEINSKLDDTHTNA